MEPLESRQMMSASPVHPVPHNAPGYISGDLFEDHNGNGVLDTNDNDGPVSGYTVYIDANRNGRLDRGEMHVVQGHNLEGPAPETIDGNYILGPLPAGNYEVLVAGIETTPNHPVGGALHVVVKPGQTTKNVDFPVVKPATIAVMAVNDVNAVGYLGAKGELDLNGWTTFIDRNHDGKLDAGDTVGATDDMGYAGNNAFYNLLPGTYSVGEVVQKGWRPTSPVFQTVTLQWGDVATVVFLDAKTVNILGRVFNDTNHDMHQEPSEPDMIGQIVFIDANKDGKYEPGEQYTYTDAKGQFSFENLPNGTYDVGVVVADGKKFTTPGIRAISLKPGETSMALLFGETAIA